ncbi:MAG: type II secretion system minor pseudopilin GspK [Pseudomonadota bacterium]
MMRRRNNQKGAALLTVLLLAAALSVLMVGMTEVMGRATRHATVAAARDQAFWVLYGLEEAALDYLRQEASDPSTPLMALFAQPIVLPTEYGSASVSFREKTNCFNLNSLVTSADDDGAYNADTGERFAFLLQALGADMTTGQILAARIADFIDQNDRAEAGSVESYDYQRREVPYRAASRPLHTVSELRTISGFTQSIYSALEPYVCIGEPGQIQALNVNTLTPADAPLLAAATRGQAPPRMIETAIQSRSVLGFQNVEEFLSRAGLEEPGGDEDDESPTWFGRETTRMEMTISVRAPMGQLSMTSLLERRGGRVRVIERHIRQAS